MGGRQRGQEEVGDYMQGRGHSRGREFRIQMETECEGLILDFSNLFHTQKKEQKYLVTTLILLYSFKLSAYVCETCIAEQCKLLFVRCGCIIGKSMVNL